MKPQSKAHQQFSTVVKQNLRLAPELVWGQLTKQTCILDRNTGFSLKNSIVRYKENRFQIGGVFSHVNEKNLYCQPIPSKTSNKTT